MYKKNQAARTLFNSLILSSVLSPNNGHIRTKTVYLFGILIGHKTKKRGSAIQ